MRDRFEDDAFSIMMANLKGNALENRIAQALRDERLTTLREAKAVCRSWVKVFSPPQYAHERFAGRQILSALQAIPTKEIK